MDIVIFYEFEERELTNACLLRCELEKRGYTVEIAKVYEARIPFIDKPKLIITPFLYHDKDVETFTSYFFQPVERILNLQYEQVISKKWLNTGFHFPKGLAKNAIHICWSEFLKNMVKNKDVNESNLFVVGDIRTDFDRSIFNEFFTSKKELSIEFKLDQEKEWVLFISSFTLPNAPEYVINDLRCKIGDDDDSEYLKNFMIDSKIIFMQWVKKFLIRNPDKEFIYRPHPNEARFHDHELMELTEKYPNFHVISKYPVQQWILSSDFINTWISTSIVDAYFMNKQCNILRPIKINEDYDSPILTDAKHICTYDEFEEVNNVKIETFPIKSKVINQYYNFPDKPVYESICDYIDLIINDSSYKQELYKENTINQLKLNLFQKNMYEITDEKIQDINNTKHKFVNIQSKINKIIGVEPGNISLENNKIEIQMSEIILKLKIQHEKKLKYKNSQYKASLEKLNQTISFENKKNEKMLEIISKLKIDHERELKSQKLLYEDKLEKLNQFILEVKSSQSWKLTRHFRKVGSWLKNR